MKTINLKPYQLSDNKMKKNEILKIIALVTMLVDHVGAMLFPSIEILRIIGRIAFPIFAYQIVQGYTHTSNYKKYMFRLWIFALISQIPYTLAFDTLRLNIMFTFVIALFFIDKIAKKEYYWFFSIMVIPFIIDIDYMWYGILLPVAFYLFRNHKVWALLVASILVLMHMGYMHQFITIYAILGVAVALFFPTKEMSLKLNRYFFYWFYPIHLVLLFIIKMIWIA